MMSLPASQRWFKSSFNIEWQFIDYRLVFFIVLLASLGLVVLASASIDYASERYNDPWFFIKKQSIFMFMGLVLASMTAAVPLSAWQKCGPILLVFALILLMVVLIPGIGKSVNGSRRWLSLGVFSIQASELAKLLVVIFFSSFLARKIENVRGNWSAFFVMLITIGLITLLLLLEPDFGSALVIVLTLGAMMFVAGVPVIRFILLALMGLAGFTLLAIMSPYRWQRLLAFMDPWSQQFDSGYQLVQSLIAFGRGEWFGLGLGNSLQKLFFLPEAHTDFIFAIYAEEFGMIGAFFLILIYMFFIVRVLINAYLANKHQNYFAYFLLFGFGVMLAVQAFINMGVASGLLPTKGLTLPFISYGGSSLLVSYMIVAIMLRACWEVRRDS